MIFSKEDFSTGLFKSDEMRPAFDEKGKEYIRANRLTTTALDMAKVLGCSSSPIIRWMKKEGINPPREVMYKLTAEKMIGRTTFNKKQDKFLKENYLRLPIAHLAAGTGKSTTGVRCRLRQLGLEIPAELIERYKTMGRIQPGSVPKNKGKKWSEFMSKEGMRNSRKTTFKKGNEPHNTKHDLAISQRIDTNGKPYLFIRIKKAKWEPLQRYVWRQEKGMIPPRRKIIFKDGNPLNCNIENLEMVTWREAMIRNSSQRFGVEVFRLIQLRGALNRQINKHLKNLQNEK